MLPERRHVSYAITQRTKVLSYSWFFPPERADRIHRKRGVRPYRYGRGETPVERKRRINSESEVPGQYAGAKMFRSVVAWRLMEN
jgi:hypothetical protein